MNEDQAKAKMDKISKMPSVVMVGLDRESGGVVTIGMEIDRSNLTNDMNDLLLGLMIAYVGINLETGMTEQEVIERSAKTMAAVLKNIGVCKKETARTETITLH